MNAFYYAGMATTTAVTLGYIMVDAYVFNAKRNRERWLSHNTSLLVQRELEQLNEWRNKPFWRQILEFSDLPPEKVFILKNKN